MNEPAIDAEDRPPVAPPPGGGTAPNPGGSVGSSGHRRFPDREQAGRELAEALEEQGVEADLVLGLPPGGLPVGRALADHLGLPLDVIVAETISAPWNDGLAIGAVTSDGETWRDEDLIRRAGIPGGDVEHARKAAVQAAFEQASRYRSAGPGDTLDGRRVLVVDDGVATGARVRVSLASVRSRGASQASAAVPVGSPDSIDELGTEADHVVCLASPADFAAAEQFYDSFEPVTHAEALAALEGALT